MLSDLLRPQLSNQMSMLLQHSIGPSKSQAQPRFSGRGNRLTLLLRWEEQYVHTEMEESVLEVHLKPSQPQYITVPLVCVVHIPSEAPDRPRVLFSKFPLPLQTHSRLGTPLLGLP